MSALVMINVPTVNRWVIPPS